MGWRRFVAGGAATLVAGGVTALVAAGPAAATAPTATTATSGGMTAAVQAAAAQAQAAGYRTGIAVLDLQTGAYAGAGEDTGAFASESVAKVFIATQLLLTGQMTGDTASTAYQMITESDDDDADALYGLAGGDDVVDEVADHYGIDDLGTGPSQPGWWGNTEITARGMVQLYAAIAKDSTVGPWLMNAMAHTTQYGADGTDQFFGLPSATTGAAVKQGWGDDGDDSPNAVFNSTGFVDGNSFAVAILTDGSPSTYGDDISAEVTAEAKALMPGGTVDDPLRHNPSVSGVTAVATGNTVHVAGTATDPDATAAAPVVVKVEEGAATVGTATVGADGRFDVAVHATDGAHQYTVDVPDVGEGTTDATATPAAVTVSGVPTGAVTSVKGGAGTVTVTGRESDPNLRPGQEPDVAVTVDGKPVRVAAVDEPTPGSGAQAVAKTGFSLTVPAPRGHDEVTVTYLGRDGAPDVTVGSWTTVVAASPQQVARRELVIAAATGVGVLLLAAGLGIGWRRRRRRTVGGGHGVAA